MFLDLQRQRDFDLQADPQQLRPPLVRVLQAQSNSSEA